MTKLVKKQSGFTLIEVIIALAVIVTGLIAGLVLATANYRASHDNISRVIAANLARAAVEAVRNTRDTNWLRSDLNLTPVGGGYYTWDRLTDSSGQSVVPAFVVGQGTPDTYTFTKVAVPAPSPSGNGCQVNDYMCACQTIDGDPCKLAFGIPVGYGYGESLHRLVVTQEICWNDTANTERVAYYQTGCEATERKIGLLVTGIVKFGNSQTVTVKEKLYNWRE